MDVTSWSGEQLAGQRLMAGFEGGRLDRALQALIAELRLGGLILFKRNIESPRQLTELCRSAQHCARDSGLPPLFIAIDQEGGQVARLGRPFTRFPGNPAMQDAADALRFARITAIELAWTGINMNLAPVLDVNSNPANPVINTRSFGGDPQLAAACGAAFVAALQGAGVMAVGKHFPGHGDTTIDSHVALPVVAHGRARLEAVEFAPFLAAMAAGVAGIMSAHVHFPAIEPTANVPATLSHRVLTGLLRDEMGYRGLLLTDSLEMGALATSGYPAPLAAAHALAAGADVLLFNTSPDTLWEAHATIVRWVEGGRLDPARLDEAVLRVLAAKQRFGLL